MKITIGNHTIEAITRKTMGCPDGVHAYYSISYMLDGEVIYTINSKSQSSQPSPIAALDWEEEKWLACNDPQTPGYFTVDGGGGKVRITKTHRAWMQDALAQLV